MLAHFSRLMMYSAEKVRLAFGGYLAVTAGKITNVNIGLRL
jgi:hypothetical protein